MWTCGFSERELASMSANAVVSVETGVAVCRRPLERWSLEVCSSRYIKHLASFSDLLPRSSYPSHPRTHSSSLSECPPIARSPRSLRHHHFDDAFLPSYCCASRRDCWQLGQHSPGQGPETGHLYPQRAWCLYHQSNCSKHCTVCL